MLSPVTRLFNASVEKEFLNISEIKIISASGNYSGNPIIHNHVSAKVIKADTSSRLVQCVPGFIQCAAESSLHVLFCNSHDYDLQIKIFGISMPAAPIHDNRACIQFSICIVPSGQASVKLAFFHGVLMYFGHTVNSSISSMIRSR